MKFIVSSEILLKKLQLIGGVLNSNNTLPILDDFLFEIKKGELSITASDLETTMVTKITIEAKEDGVIAIPAKLLLDTLKTFPDQPLTFTIDKENFGIEISSDYGKYKFISQMPVPYDAGGGLIRPAHFHLMISASGYQSLGKAVNKDTVMEYV